MDREIYIDRKCSASLRTRISTMQFLTAEAAVAFWRKLSSDEQSHSVLVLVTGEIYQPAEIELIRFER